MNTRSQPKRNRRKFFTILVAALSQERYNSLSMEDWEWLRWENQPLAARDEPLLFHPARSGPRLACLPRLFSRVGPASRSLHARSVQAGFCSRFFLGNDGVRGLSGPFCFLMNEFPG